MSEQLVFRLVFATLFLLLFAVVGTYRRRAQRGRRIDYSKEGGALFLALRLGGLALWAYCVLYIAYPKPLAWSFLAMPSELRWLGAGVVLGVLPFLASAQRALGRNVSPTVTTHEDHQLVTSGPYGWVRNPLYVAGALVFTGLGLVSSSWFLVAAAVVALFLVWLRLPREEAQLEARFGQEYRDYVHRTGRFLPRWPR